MLKYLKRLDYYIIILTMKVYWKDVTIDKLIIINLEPKELFLESIIEVLKEKKINNSVIISGIGTLEKLVFHRVLTRDFPPQNEFITLEAPIELSSCQGLILDYEPHIHFVASDLERTYSGHLEFGSKVLYLAEIVILPLKNVNLTRKLKENNIKYIEEE